MNPIVLVVVLVLETKSADRGRVRERRRGRRGGSWVERMPKGPLFANCRAGQASGLSSFIGVAAGVSPAVEPGIRPGGTSSSNRTAICGSPKSRDDPSGGQDATLYGSQPGEMSGLSHGARRCVVARAARRPCHYFLVPATPARGHRALRVENCLWPLP